LYVITVTAVNTSWQQAPAESSAAESKEVKNRGSGQMYGQDTYIREEE
jgi:hypothetical protein